MVIKKYAEPAASTARDLENPHSLPTMPTSVLLRFTSILKHPGYWEGGILEGSTSQNIV